VKKSKAKDSDDDSEDYSTTKITDVNAQKDNFAPAPYMPSTTDVSVASLLSLSLV